MSKERKQFRASVSRGVKGEIDRESNVIKGLSVISVGEAMGHGVLIDEKTVDQVVDQGNSHGDKGIKSRFGHPNMSAPAVGSALGRLRNFRVDDEDKYRARADLHLGDYAFSSPNGDLGTYTLDLAEEDPGQFGASIVFDMVTEPQQDEEGNVLEDKMPFARVKTLYAADVVDEPATGDGLFSKFFSKTVMPSAEMTVFLDKYLKEPEALENVIAFLKKYQENDLYKEKREQLKEVENIIEGIIKTKKERESSMDNPDKKDTKPQFLPDDKEGKNMDKEKLDAETQEKRDKEIAEAAAETERLRVETIRETCSELGIKEEFAKKLIDDKVALEEANKMIIEQAKVVLKEKSSVNTVDVVKDGSDERRIAMQNALMVTSGVERDQKVKGDVRKTQYAGMGLQGLARMCLQTDGESVGIMSGEALYKAMVSRGYFSQAPAQGSGDFVNVISNVLNKSLGKGWALASTTFDSWVGTGTLKDFKTADLPRITEIGDVERIREGQAPKQAKMDDMKEQTRLETYGGKYIISRQAIVNDDLGVITDVPAKQARALKIKMNKLCYGLVYDSNGSNSAFEGPTMNEDSAKCFNATAESTAGGHANLIAAASGGIVTKAALNLGFIALAKHKILSPDESRSADRYMNIRPRYLIHGVKDFMNSWALLNYPGYNDTNDDSKAAGTVAANIFASGSPRALQLIQEVELDFIDDTYIPWYLVADNAEVDTVTLYTLNGNTSPYTDAAPTPTGDARGMIWVIEHDFVFAVPDWRGMYCNSGATK